MARNKWRIFVVAVLLATLVGCGGEQRSTRTDTPAAEIEQPYVHAFTGMSFPAQLVGFTRGEVHTYDSWGRNTSVGFTNERGIIVTVYVYPVPDERLHSPDALAIEFQDAANAIGYFFSDLVLEEVTVVEHTQDGVDTAGFRLDASGFLESETGWQHVSTSLVLFQYGSWFLKYRATYDYEMGESGRFEVQSLIDALTWPVSPPYPGQPAPTPV